MKLEGGLHIKGCYSTVPPIHTSGSQGWIGILRGKARPAGSLGARLELKQVPAEHTLAGEPGGCRQHLGWLAQGAWQVQLQSDARQRMWQTGADGVLHQQQDGGLQQGYQYLA